MEEPLLQSDLDRLIQNVRENRYKPFSRGKHIQVLTDYVLNNGSLSYGLNENLFSVINDCFFPGQIEDILTRSVERPCFLALATQTNLLTFRQYPALVKVWRKYDGNISFLLHKFLEHMPFDLSGDKIRRTFRFFKEHHADFNAKDAKGNTPLHIAASRGLVKFEVSRSSMSARGGRLIVAGGALMLLVQEFGAAPALVNNRNKTPSEMGLTNQDISALNKYLNEKVGAIIISIEKRDVAGFEFNIDKLGVANIEYLQKLLNGYEKEKEKGWHTFGQWRRNRKVKEMLELTLNHVLFELRQMAARGVNDRQSETINQYLGMLNEFASEKISEALWRDVRRNGGRLFKFIEDNARGFSEVVIAAESMRQSERPGFPELPFRVGTVVESFSAVARATSGNNNNNNVADSSSASGDVFVKSKKETPISKWLAAGGDPTKFDATWFDRRALADSELIQKMLDGGYWKLVFSAAINEKLRLNMVDRQLMFELILRKIEAENVSPTSQLILGFSLLLKSMSLSILEEAFAPAFIVVKPTNLLCLLKDLAKLSSEDELVTRVGYLQLELQSGPAAKHA